MADEGVRRLIEEATRESLNQSFVEAGKKYIAAAEALEREGKDTEAHETYKKAAEAYEKAADNYRSSKSYKNAALNMCLAGDVYADLADSEQAIRAYARAAEDLLAASDEHLMWGEDAETQKGTALAVAATMIYLMVGMEDKAFQAARAFSAKNASKLRFPATIRLSQIPQMLESAIRSVDIDSFASAENAVVTELKAVLSNANAQQFIKYVDKGLDMAREILRGQLKVPKVQAHLEIPVDMTFSEEFPLQVVIANAGDGDALDVKAEWYLDDGLVLVSGEKVKSFASIPPGESVTMEIVARAAEQLEGVREYEVLVRGSYLDMLKTEYTLQAGPGTLVLKDFKMTEKLQHDADVTEGRLSLLRSSIEQSGLESEPLLRVVDALSDALVRARTEIGEKELDTAKARIAVVNQMVDTLDNLIGDDELIARVKQTRESEKKAFAKAVIEGLREYFVAAVQKGIARANAEAQPALAQWDDSARQLKGIARKAQELREEISEVVASLEQIYAQLPTAATTDNPEEAARRTKTRNAIEEIRSKLATLRGKSEEIATASILQPGERPAVPEKVELAVGILRELQDQVADILQKKQAEL
ncbi:MAG: hypothetical protein ACTSYX_12990 [Candidatus Thorarchaeota archaeon]